MKAGNGWRHLAQSLQFMALLTISPCRRLHAASNEHQIAVHYDNSAVSDSDTSAERWLRSGTEYAIGEKLLLPKHWYQDIHLNTDSMDPLEGQLHAVPCLALHRICEPSKHDKQHKAHMSLLTVSDQNY